MVTVDGSDLVKPDKERIDLIGGLLHNMNAGAVTVFATRSTKPAVLHAAIRSDSDTIMGMTEHFAGLVLGDRAVRMPRLHRAICGGERRRSGRSLFGGKPVASIMERAAT